MSRLLLILLLGCRCFASGTNTLIIPPDRRDSFGNARGGIVAGPSDYQLFYDRANFKDTLSETISIVGLGFRIDDNLDTVDISVPVTEVWASTFVKQASELSKFSSDNWGSDRIQVFREKNVHFSGIPETNQPEHFQVAIRFQKPFLYDRSYGNLLLDFKTEGRYPNTGDSGYTDGDVRDDGAVFKISRIVLGEPLILRGGDVLQVFYISIPRIEFATSEVGRVELSFFAVEGAAYAFEFKSSLSATPFSWTTITNVPPGAARCIKLEIGAGTGEGYFRLVLR